MQPEVSALRDCVLGVAYAIASVVAAAIVIAKLSSSNNLEVCKKTRSFILVPSNQLSPARCNSDHWANQLAWVIVGRHEGCYRQPPGRVRESKWIYSCSVNLRSRHSQYKTAPFKMTDGSRWLVVFGGRQHIEELRKATEDVLSFIEAADDVSGKI